MPINSFLYPAKNVPVVYEVANSCRFEDSSDDGLNRTLGTPTNNYKWTISFWLKRTELGVEDAIMTSFTNTQNRGMLLFRTDDQLEILDLQSDSYVMQKKTNRKFRDVSAWYHIVISSDATLSSPATKFYVNGVEETSFATTNEYTQNQANKWNSAIANYIGNDSSTRDFSGYLAEFVFIDGQALAADQFGEFDSDSPTIWKPIDVSGLTFGNNGFYLDFEDSSNLGNDANGGTDWTVSNLTAIDQTTDTCTNNFCTVNSLDNYHQQATLSEGNTKITFKGPSSYYAYSTGTFGVANGRWYWETKATSAANHDVYGISGRYVIAYNKGLGVNTDEYGYYNYNGNYTNAATDGSYREVSFPGGNVTWTTNDIIGVALDLDSGTNTVKFYKNNALIGTIDIIAPSSGFYYPAWNQFDNQAEVAQPNFGNPSYSLSSAQSDANGYGSFEYAPPSGYFALCSKNLAEFG